MFLQDYIDADLLKKTMEDGYVERKDSPCGNFYLLDYTRSATFDRMWNDASIKCRGLVIDSHSDEIVGMCIPKFYNWQQVADTEEYKKALDLPFKVYEKMDGSFINAWWNKYTESWQCSTRGSFASDQAIWATKWLNEKLWCYGVDISGIFPNSWIDRSNYIFECIYPENRIVVDYGDTEELVLLAGYCNGDIEIGFEDLNAIAKDNGFLRPTCYDGGDSFKSIDDIIENCKTLDANHEGYVVQFENGYRVKYKGTEYCNLHSIISGLSTKAVWENIKIDNGYWVNVSWFKEVPEEFEKDVRDYYDYLFVKMMNDFMDIKETYDYAIKGRFDTKKEMVLHIKDWYPKIFSELLLIDSGKINDLYERIWKRHKPEFKKLIAKDIDDES